MAAIVFECLYYSALLWFVTSECVSEKRLLSLLLDRAERPLPHTDSLCQPALLLAVWIQLQTFWLWENRRLTAACLTGSSCVLSGTAGKLTRKRHDIKAKTLAVKISLRLMPRCFVTDNARDLNKGNVSVWNARNRRMKSKVEKKDANECQPREADVRNKGSHCLLWRCLTCF